MRVGIGFDLHRLVAGRRFILGGVEIPFPLGPEGHSDGDALCHAIADALLGAAVLGDIGQWFPPDDASFCGANSIELLGQVRDGVKNAGFRIINVDSCVITERPKLSPHYLEMRQRLARTLEIDINDVSVKATTMEKLGEIGRGEAVAAKAVVLVERIKTEQV